MERPHAGTDLGTQRLFLPSRRDNADIRPAWSDLRRAARGGKSLTPVKWTPQSYDTWNTASTASVVSFLATIIYVSRQVPGKILLAKMCAWVPYFLEASNRVPRSERIAFARKYRLDSHL